MFISQWWSFSFIEFNQFVTIKLNQYEYTYTHLYTNIYRYVYYESLQYLHVEKNDHLARHIKDIFSQSNTICVFVDAFIHMYNFIMQNLNSLLT